MRSSNKLSLVSAWAPSTLLSLAVAPVSWKRVNSLTCQTLWIGGKRATSLLSRIRGAVAPAGPSVQYVKPNLLPVYNMLSVTNKNKLITHTASKIIDLPTPKITDLNDRATTRPALTIADNTDYPLNHNLTLLPSGRRYRTPKRRRARFNSSFIASATVNCYLSVHGLCFMRCSVASAEMCLFVLIVLKWLCEHIFPKGQ